MGWPGHPDSHAFIAQAPVVIIACGSEKECATGYYVDGQFVINDGQTVAEVMEKKGLTASSEFFYGIWQLPWTTYRWLLCNLGWVRVGMQVCMTSC